MVKTTHSNRLVTSLPNRNSAQKKKPSTQDICRQRKIVNQRRALLFSLSSSYRCITDYFDLFSWLDVDTRHGRITVYTYIFSPRLYLLCIMILFGSIFSSDTIKGLTMRWVINANSLPHIYTLDIKYENLYIRNRRKGERRKPIHTETRYYSLYSLSPTVTQQRIYTPRVHFIFPSFDMEKIDRQRHLPSCCI